MLLALLSLLLLGFASTLSDEVWVPRPEVSVYQSQDAMLEVVIDDRLNVTRDQIKWYRIEETRKTRLTPAPIVGHYTGRVRGMRARRDLQVKGAQLHDSGVYAVEVECKEHITTKLFKLTVVEMLKPIIVEEDTVKAVLGDPVTLRAILNINPSPPPRSLVWTYTNPVTDLITPLNTALWRYANKRRKLMLREMSTGLAGVYTCSVRYGTEVVSASTTLSYYTGEEVITPVHSEVNATIDTDVALGVVINSAPFNSSESEVLWYKWTAGAALQGLAAANSSGHYAFSEDQWTLNVQQAVLSDNGHYIVKVINGGLEAFTRIRLNVLSKGLTRQRKTESEI